MKIDVCFDLSSGAKRDQGFWYLGGEKTSREDGS